MFRSGALAAGAVTALAAFTALPVATAAAAPPAPCNNTPQITDASGDGHHAPTDVVSAWWSEANGRLQAVIKVSASTLGPEHGDTAVPMAGYAFVYSLGPQPYYVRASVPTSGPATFDHGTYTGGLGFVSAGATTGVVEPAPGLGGTVTIDVPAVPAGTRLIGLRVLTYDGPDFVDHAPGGTSFTDSARGADYVVGSCSAAPPSDGPAPIVRTTAIDLSAPRKLTGAGKATIKGRVTPARAGVPVDVTVTGAKPVTRRVTSATDGSFSLSVSLTQKSTVRAVAEGLGSQTLTVEMKSRVRIKVRRLKSGTVVVSGTTSPKLSGRVLLLRSNAVKATARTTARNGRFELRLKHPKRGRYQAVFIPSGDRAERSTSNTGVIR